MDIFDECQKTCGKPMNNTYNNYNSTFTATTNDNTGSTKKQNTNQTYSLSTTVIAPTHGGIVSETLIKSSLILLINLGYVQPIECYLNAESAKKSCEGATVLKFMPRVDNVMTLVGG